VLRIRKQISNWPALAACLFFFAAGRVFIPHLGIQNDEALFAGAYYQPTAGCRFVEIFSFRIPVMLMAYLGTLKAFLYSRLDHWMRPTVSSIRTPMVLAGVVTLWLFYLLLRRISGRRAAIVGCVLLAADTMYFLTTCFDWGPVALQHLLMVGALLLLLRFYQDRSEFALAGAFFLLGLQIWDKAIGLWMVGGGAVALVTVFPRPVFHSFTVRRAATAVLAAALGAAPFLAFNLASKPRWATFRGNGFYVSDLRAKAMMAPTVLNGKALLGWMVEDDRLANNPHEPRNLLQRGAFRLSEASGHPRANLLAWAFGAALLLAVLARGPELGGILFALVAMGVAWLQMAVTIGAGGSAHHVVLLWPLPHMVMALSFTAAARRLGRWALPALAAAVVPVVLSCLLLTNQYYVQMIRNGGAMNWNDGIYALADYMKTVPARFVFITDWGILDSLRLLSRGHIPLYVGSDPISKPVLDEADKKDVLRLLTVENPVFVGHTPPFEFFQGTGAMLKKTAAELGYHPEILAVIEDRYQKPVYEVLRFKPR
jgi:hypothetical protein